MVFHAVEAQTGLTALTPDARVTLWVECHGGKKFCVEFAPDLALAVSGELEACYQTVREKIPNSKFQTPIKLQISKSDKKINQHRWRGSGL
ncbi:MAG: hypothetical protein LBK76_04500 [Verrucomicrobiales bacterium]|nr:hypothetical protein [Verrucomicrobiales bacterium]